MIKKTGTLLVFCCFLIAAMPGPAPAVQSISRQNLVNKNIEVLQNKLEAAAADDSTPLHALTIDFLEKVRLYGFLKDTSILEVAVNQYVSDVQEQAEAAELNAACVVPLLYSISVNGGNMLQEVASGDAPVCQAISLSSSAAAVISAKYSYDICVDPTVQADRAAKQTGLKYFSFAASVLDVFVCNPSAGVQTYVGLLYNLVMLFLTA